MTNFTGFSGAPAGRRRRIFFQMTFFVELFINQSNFSEKVVFSPLFIAIFCQKCVFLLFFKNGRTLAGSTAGPGRRILKKSTA